MKKVSILFALAITVLMFGSLCFAGKEPNMPMEAFAERAGEEYRFKETFSTDSVTVTVEAENDIDDRVLG